MVSEGSLQIKHHPCGQQYHNMNDRSRYHNLLHSLTLSAGVLLNTHTFLVCFCISLLMSPHWVFVHLESSGFTFPAFKTPTACSNRVLVHFLHYLSQDEYMRISLVPLKLHRGLQL